MSRRVLVAVALLVALLPLALHARLTDDVLRLLPSDAGAAEALRTVRAFGVGDVLLFEVDGTGASPEALDAAARALAADLRAVAGITRVDAGLDLDQAVAIRAVVAAHAPALVPPALLAERTSPEGVRRALQTWLAELSGPAGALAAARLRDDPLRLEEAALHALGAGVPGKVAPRLGGLRSVDGDRALVIATTGRSPTETTPGDPFVGALHAAAARQALPVQWTGGHRVASATAAAVRADVSRAVGLGALTLLVVLGFGFRRLTPLLGALAPLVPAGAAGVAMAGLISPLHGIQIAFVGTLAGLATDYWIHLYLAASAALRRSPEAGRAAAAARALTALRAPLLLSAGSTALAFAVLATSQIPLVRDLGLLGMAATTGAVAGTFLLGPLAFRLIGPDAWTARYRPPRPHGALAAIVVLALLGMGALGARLQTDPSALLSRPAAIASLERHFDATWGLGAPRGLAVVHDADPSATRDRAARLEAALSGLGFVAALGPGALLPGPATRAQRADALPDVDTLQAALDAAADEVGLRPFPGAAAWIPAATHADLPADAWAHTALGHRVASHLADDGRLALISVPITTPDVLPLLADTVAATDPDATWVVPTDAAGRGLAGAVAALGRAAPFIVLAVFTLLWLRTGSPRTALRALAPAAAGLVAATGALALAGVPWNVVSLAGIVLIVGLAIDYGVFTEIATQRTRPRAPTRSGPPADNERAASRRPSPEHDPLRMERTATPPSAGPRGRPRAYFETPRPPGTTSWDDSGFPEQAATTRRAIGLGAATTAAGFAALVFAESPALHGLGLAVTSGLLAAAAVPLLILPALDAPSRPLAVVARWAPRAVLFAILALHADVLLNIALAIRPPMPAAPPPAVSVRGPVAVADDARLVHTEGLRVVATAGSPYASGLAYGALTAPLRERVERELFASFRRQVPSPLSRWLVTRGSLIAGVPLRHAIRAEDLAQLQGVVDAAPEPWRMKGSPFTRRVYYHALHDLGQALTDTPLLGGCTGFVAGGDATAGGRWLLARNFDFEGGVTFDRDKVVWVHRPDDGIPFVTVGFAGMIGAVSGVNARGLGVALNAAGSDAAIRPGTPMTLILREILQTADSIDAAEAILHARKGFVAENVLIVDGHTGAGAIFEVAPDRLARRDVDGWAAASNHFVTDVFADDATNQRRQVDLTTVPRLARMEERVASAAGRLDLETSAAILMDRAAVGGSPLPHGHRHALDADIATHAVVIDATERVLWVSRFPNVSAGFVAFRVDDLIAGRLEGVEAIPPRVDADRALRVAHGRDLLRQARRASARRALPLAEEALHAMPEHPEALLEVGRALTALGRSDEARPLLERALAAPPEYPAQAAAIRALLEAR